MSIKVEKIMKFLTLLIFIGGVWANHPSQRLGCELEPCQHKCVDTVDSYYCECFENFILQPDRHSCLHKNTEALDSAYLGCWTDQEEARDLPYRIWTRTDDASVPECTHDCNARGFDFAGLQSGTECWCSNTYQRAYTEDGVCNSACPGAPAQNCGGTLSNAVYKVARDERYMGCFTEDPDDLDLPYLQWGPTEGKSVDECITTCGSQGFNYSGIFDGGQCSCGNSFGKHGSPGELFCNVPCFDGYAGSNCGGNTTNAVYRVTRGLNLAGLQKLGAYKTEGNRAELNMDILYVYPNYLGIYTKRLMVYASDTVNTVYDDISCANGDCYSLCGEIDVPAGLDRYRSDVVIRRFNLRLTEVQDLVSFPEEAERVYVFAQTFHIDQSVDFPWSLYIRARQIIVNYEANPSITFDHNGPEFSEDIPEAVIYGLPSDLVFQKQSLLCAKMMISSTTDEHNRIGWDIIDDLARDRAYDREQQDFLDHVRAVRAGFTSVGRNDLHWAPYYTQVFYVNTLEIFYDQITVYNDVFEEMLDEFMECEDFVDRAGTLIGIWTDTVVAQAEIIKNHAADNLAISRATYQGIIEEIQESIEELKVAAQEFIEGIKKAIRQLIRKALFGLVGSILNMALGVSPAGAKQAEDDLEAAAEGTINLDGFAVTVENLAKGSQHMYIFNSITEPITQTEDFERYIDSVEIVSGLYTLLPEWANLKYHIDVIFRAPVFREIEGALGFAFACFDLANWGEALNRALIEHATNLRLYVSATALWKSKVEMQLRYDIYFAEVQQDCNKQGRTLIRFAEQNYDMALELNDQLLQYCQAFYYEEMMFCPEGSRPNFAYSVTELLTTVNQAKLNALYFSRRSTGRIDIEIVDSPEAWNNCTDTKVCPVKLFRETRMLYYELPLDHPRFEGLDLYVIEELEVYLQGAFSTDSTDYVRLLLSTSGPFYNRRGSEVSTFLTRALTEMKFQYDMVTGVIELHADLYKTSGATIKHMTPFTTWLIQVDPAFGHIDISQVDMIQIVFHGPFLNRLDEEGEAE